MDTSVCSQVPRVFATLTEALGVAINDCRDDIAEEAKSDDKSLVSGMKGEVPLLKKTRASLNQMKLDERRSIAARLLKLEPAKDRELALVPAGLARDERTKLQSMPREELSRLLAA